MKYKIILLALCICMFSGCNKYGQPIDTENHVNEEPVNPLITSQTDTQEETPALPSSKDDFVMGIRESILRKLEYSSVVEAAQLLEHSYDPESIYNISASKSCDEDFDLYYWYPGGREYSTNREGYLQLLFSGPMWLPESKCIGILIEFETSFPNWNDETISVEAAYEFSKGEITWVPTTEKEPAHYEQKQDLCEMKIYTNEDGTKLLENTSVLIQMGGNEIIGPFPPHRLEVLSPDMRNGSDWMAINKYIEEIDTPKEELIAKYHSTPELDGYKDEIYVNDVGIAHKFDEEDESCYLVEVPATEIFPELANGSIEIYDLLDMMGVNAEWAIGGDVYGYSYLYSYIFKDVTILVSSDPNRAITKDSMVFIMD